jgi:hypothetical protein
VPAQKNGVSGRTASAQYHLDLLQFWRLGLDLMTCFVAAL